MAQLTPIERKMEKAVVKPQRMNGAILIRPPKTWSEDLIHDWNGWRRLATDWGAWRDMITNWIGKEETLFESADIQLVKHNGLGGDGVCPFHGYQHFEILPINGTPMTCMEAKKVVR